MCEDIPVPLSWEDRKKGVEVSSAFSGLAWYYGPGTNCTIRAQVFGTLNSAIINFQT